MNSGIYRGWIRHRRTLPVPHAFRSMLFMMYLDLDELPDLFDPYPFWSARGTAPASFRREDFHGDPAVPLAEAVRRTVEAQTGHRPEGPIRMLAHLRYFGHCFNPVTFYYCWDGGAHVQTIVAEITNTPWGERHAYVLGPEHDEGRGGVRRFQFPKAFHVSPFMAMGLQYDWRFSDPGERLVVHMENRQASGKFFDATLVLRRQPISGPALLRVLVQHPLMTLQVVGAIHWQAFRLWWKGVPVHTHPARQSP